MASDLDIISGALIFDGLPGKQLEQIKDVAISKNYTRGEIIFMEQDMGNGFYLVAEGMVKISRYHHRARSKFSTFSAPENLSGKYRYFPVNDSPPMRKPFENQGSSFSREPHFWD